MKALSILSSIAAVVAGCMGAPDAGIPVGAHADSLDAVAPEVVPDSDTARAALAADLWCPACVAEGLGARFAHDVRFHASDRSEDVFVEIDGALACAGRATARELDLMVELESKQAGGGEDEGNPDPEPALDDELPPSPAPPPNVRNSGGEDEGNPDPEPALGDDLPTPTPGLDDPGDFGK